MNTENMIEITGCNLRDLVKVAYDLSSPQGLGFLHAEEGGLTDEEAESLVSSNKDDKIPVSLDYVKGRACKMTVFRDNDRLFIRDSWFDHSEEDLVNLLDKIAD